MEQTIDLHLIALIALLIVTAVGALLLALRVIPALDRINNRLRDTEVATRGILDNTSHQAAPEQADDIDWIEKYQALALRVAAVIDTDYQPPTTYNDAATLGYRDGAKAVITDLRATLTPTEGT